MSYVHTVLNAVTLPAMPDMNDAISAHSPRPEHARREVVLQHHRDRQVVVERDPAIGADYRLTGLVELRRNQPLGGPVD